MGLVCAESEGFCDCSCAWCWGLWGGFVVYVVGEGVGFVVVGAFERVYAEVFVFAFHFVAPWVLCLWSFCLSVWSLVLPLLIFAMIQNFGGGSVRVAYVASASAQSWSSWVFGAGLKVSLPFFV